MKTADKHQHLQAVVGHIPREHYVERIVALDDLGRLDKRVLYETVGVEFELSDADVARLHRDFWSRFPAHTHPFSEVIQTLEALRGAGIQIGIVTNGWIAVQEAKIAQLGLSGLIDVVLISEREGVRKPNPEIFERALARLGLQASDAWFVGDNPDDDVAGAVNAGLRVFWRECPDWPRPTAECETIRTIDELLTLLPEESPGGTEESPETMGSQSQ